MTAIKRCSHHRRGPFDRVFGTRGYRRYRYKLGPSYQAQMAVLESFPDHTNFLSWRCSLLLSPKKRAVTSHNPTFSLLFSLSFLTIQISFLGAAACFLVPKEVEMPGHYDIRKDDLEARRYDGQFERGYDQYYPAWRYGQFGRECNPNYSRRQYDRQFGRGYDPYYLDSSDEEITEFRGPPFDRQFGRKRYGQYSLGLGDWRVKPGYENLCEAVLKDDWNTAEKLFTENAANITAKISQGDDTVLHIAAATGLSLFVEKLVDLLEPADLEIKNKDGNTAFFLVAASGNVQLAEKMYNKNRKLHKIPGKGNVLPIDIAARSSKSEMVNFLYRLPNNESESEAFMIESFRSLIKTGLYDMALEWLRRCPELATARAKSNKQNNKEKALEMIAAPGESKEDKALEMVTAPGESNEDKAPVIITAPEESKKDMAPEIVTAPGGSKKDTQNVPSACVESKEETDTALGFLVKKFLEPSKFDNQDQQGCLKGFFNSISGSDKFYHSKLDPNAVPLVTEIWEKVKLSFDRSDIIEELLPLMFRAAAQGQVELLNINITQYPALMMGLDPKGRTLFDVAIWYRQKDVFKLLNNISPSSKKKILQHKDNDGNNILHFAAMLAPHDQLNTAGDAARQLQDDILWFKEVMKIADPSIVEDTNKYGKTPRDLFTEQHMYLKEKRERWMKDTANSCMIVATLIATVVFAAAFTIPGGIKEGTGTPYVIKRNSFIIFVISDAISLVSSTCSIITFLSILTSQYEDDEFLYELPRKLILGLATLLSSIAAMMAVFGSTVFIVFKDGVLWVPLLVSFFVFVPVIFFLMQHLRLFSTVLVLILRSDYSLFQIVNRQRSWRTSGSFFP